MNLSNRIRDLEPILEWVQGLEEVVGEVEEGEAVEVGGEVEGWGEEEGGVGEDDPPGLGVIMKRELMVKDRYQRATVCRIRTLVLRGTNRCNT